MFFYFNIVDYMDMKHLFLSLILLTCACNFAPKYTRPELDLPDDTALQDYSVFTRYEWWTIFEDETLDKLEAAALAFNRDLVSAMARVDEARAEAGVVSADSMPRIGYSAGGLRGGGSEAEPDINHYSAGVGASYEIDFWGKQKNLKQAAKARLLESEAMRDVVRLTLTADVAKTYFAILALDAEITTAQRTLSKRQKTVSLLKNKTGGAYEEMNFHLSAALRDFAQINMLEMEKQISALQSALAVLIGGSPAHIAEGKLERGLTLSEVFLVPDIPSGTPSSILQNRPDVRAAEFKLIEAGANIGVARAAYFPAISLTASASVISESLTSLFTGGVWNFFANASGPIFRGGKIRAQVEMQTARQKEMVADYERAVQNAFKETYDAMTENSINRKTFLVLTEREKALAAALAAAQKELSDGKVNYMDVFAIERLLFDTQLARDRALLAQLNSVVDISKALGGGFHYSDAPSNSMHKK